MPADGIQIKLDGVLELKRALADATTTIRTKAVRGALRDAARVIQKQARQLAPILRVPTKTRKPGTVKRRISVRASKFARQQGKEGVFINVRPIRGAAQIKRFGKASATNPHDPYYWRFLEFGTRKMRARPFLRPAVAAKGEEAIRVFMNRVIPQIQRLNQKAVKR